MCSIRDGVLRPSKLLHRPQLEVSPLTSPIMNLHIIHNPSKMDISYLYPEILALIFRYLDTHDKGRAAQVCTAWRDASYNKSVWRGTEAKMHLKRACPTLFPSLVKRGIRKMQILSLRRSLRDVVLGIPNLESLNLSGCYNVTDFAMSHAFVSDQLSIRTLNLSLCKQVTDQSLGRIAQCLKNLEVLDLGGCMLITNTGLLLIAWGLKHLKNLNLRSCWHISDQGISHLAGLNPESADGNLRLEHLGLQDCQRITDDALKFISQGLSSLRSINLSFCVNVSDNGMKYLAKMSNLQEVNLRACDNITDLGIAYLAEGGSKISFLDVSFCDKIGDQAMVYLSQGLFHIRVLSMSTCSITDEGVCRIAKSLLELETLHIGQCNKVTDKSLLMMAESLKNLRVIDLYGCISISSVGIDSLMKMPQLKILNLALWQMR